MNSTIKGSITLVTGGSGSGKSLFAETLIAKQAREVVYVATCNTEVLKDDAEMIERIRKHQKQRPSEWFTYENEMDLCKIAAECRGKAVLLDCLTLWLSDGMTRISNSNEILKTLEDGLKAMIAANIHLVVVSNEIGSGIVPLGAGVREYRDLVGKGNQCVASMSEDVHWVVSGIPVQIKSNGVPCHAT